MAPYCGTEHCRLICVDWSNLAGTDASAIITEASAMVDAYLNDFSMSPPQPVTYGGTVYDYYIRRATAHLAVWLAAESMYRYQYEIGADGWWDKHRQDAEAIFDGLRSGRHVQGRSIAVWERGIAPAVPVANGTITAPSFGGIISNSEIPEEFYTDDRYSRTYIVEYDGSGTDAYTQTVRWMYKGGTGWEHSTQPIVPGEWLALTHGVAVSIDPRYTGTALATGQRYEIECNPSRQKNYKSSGLSVWTKTK